MAAMTRRRMAMAALALGLGGAIGGLATAQPANVTTTPLEPLTLSPTPDANADGDGAGFGGGLFAPEEAAPSAAEPTPEAAPTPAPTPAPRQASSPDTEQRSGDWARQCRRQRCWIQTGLAGPNGRVAALLRMGRREDGGLYGELRLPVGLHIPSGVLAEIDDALTFRPTLIMCDGRFCLAAFNATDQLVDALRQGDALTARLADARNGERVALRFSLIGFTALAKTI